MRKLLVSAVLAGMVLACGLSASAAGGTIAGPAFSDIAGYEAEAELTLLGTLGIFTGEYGLGGAVNPDDPITRAQFCKVVVVAFNRGSVATSLMGLRPTFTDEIPAWAWGYVDVAMYMGLINGYEDGTFRANQPVTYAEAVTMLVRAVPGHLKNVPPGTWPYTFLFYGVDNGFTGDVNVGFAGLPCARGDMARMLFAAMKVNPIVPQHATPHPILENGVRLFKGTLDAYDLTAGAINIHGYAGALTLDDPVYMLGAQSYPALKANTVLAVKNLAGEVVFLQRVSGNVVSGVLKRLDHDTGDPTKTYILLKEGTKVYYTLGPAFGAVPVILNNDTISENDEEDLEPGDELTINVDTNGKAILVYALRWDLIRRLTGTGTEGDPYVYAHGYWDYVAEKVIKSTTTTETKISFPGGEDGSPFFYDDDPGADIDWTSLNGETIEIPAVAALTINGQLANRNDLAKSDVVKAATYGAKGYDHDKVIAVAATRSVVEGTVTGITTTYPGPHYKVTLKQGAESRTYEYNTTYVGNPGLGSVHKYAIDEAGQLFWDITFSSNKPVVLVTGHQDVSTGTEVRHYLIVDNHGATANYEYSIGTGGFIGSLQGLVGHFVELTVSGATGLLVPVEGGIPDCCPHNSGYIVRGVGSGNVTLQHGTGGPFSFLIDPPATVYKVDEGVFTYIGPAGLDADDEVWVDDAPKVILRDDSTPEWWDDHIPHL